MVKTIYRRITRPNDGDDGNGANTMADKYKGKYRIPSTRLASWDYGSNAAYFITICTHRRAHAFGEVIDGEVHLTPLGQSAWDHNRGSNRNGRSRAPAHFAIRVITL
jgi:hypothetical protein